ncbi:lipase family alpha/beta hydrolase [Dokdonella sp. MW10]|uniref:lipase family alpha/beta hydrolase n=1 Tax=Dokdonella sp. MW10 TaxID=2992926 RepID=UPI003F7DCD8F
MLRLRSLRPRLPMARLPFRFGDLRAYGRLAVDATLGFADLCENMQHNVSRLPRVLGTPVEEPARGVTGFVYRSIRRVTRGVGFGVDRVLAHLPADGEVPLSQSREALVGAINGVIGDHLASTANPLQIDMALRREGRSLVLDRASLARDLVAPSGRIVLLAHGLCMNDLQWRRGDHDHGAALAADAGFTPVYLHYNSGLHISSNGARLAEMLDELVAAWPVPVEELAIIGYSMGGLVARSACEHARRARRPWLAHLRRIVFLGTPHAGSPLERSGSRLDAMLAASPYTSALSRIGRVRSVGITDLRDAALLDTDWMASDRASRGNGRRPRVSMPRTVRCYAIAGSLARRPDSLGGRVLGDGLVPLDSALGYVSERSRALRIPASRQWIAYGTGHLGLLWDARVYARILEWMREPAAGE